MFDNIMLEETVRYVENILGNELQNLSVERAVLGLSLIHI